MTVLDEGRISVASSAGWPDDVSGCLHPESTSAIAMDACSQVALIPFLMVHTCVAMPR
jgi:hypothetical protein